MPQENTTTFPRGVVRLEQELMKLAASQGIFAALFVGLLFYVLKENSKREGKYQEVISDLSNKLGIIEDIREDVREIKTEMNRKG